MNFLDTAPLENIDSWDRSNWINLDALATAKIKGISD
jgi:hypothetical protein